MPSEPPKSPLRVLIVDEDRAVRDRLGLELAAAGYEVDTLASGTGLTEDMVGLLRPDLLLVDPILRDLPLPVVERALLALRLGGKLKLILIDAGERSERIEALVASCGADGSISKRELLRAPVDAVVEQFLPEAELVEALPEPPPLPSAAEAARLGIDIELGSDLGGPPRTPASAASPRVAARPRPLPSASGKATQIVRPPVGNSSKILGLIQEEIGDLSRAPAPEQTPYRVAVSLFSRHNFYVGATGDLTTGGVFIATSVLPRVGERLRVDLELPGSPPLATEGPVEWVRPGNQVGRVTSGGGVSLAHLSKEERAPIERFFGERAPLTHLPKR